MLKNLNVVLPDVCDCGELLDINVTLTQISCENPKCYLRISSLMHQLLQKIGVDITLNSSVEFVRSLGITNPYTILFYEPELPNGDIGDGPLPYYDMVFSKKVYKSLKKCKDGINRIEDYVVLVNPSNIPYSILKKIFKDEIDLYLFYDNLQKEGVTYITEKLGYMQEEEDVLNIDAFMVYDMFMSYGEIYLEYYKDIIEN